MQKKKGSKKSSSQGFSLVETLVAISILLFAVGGPLTIAHRALSDANVAKNQTTATFLAQDAIEYIKNVRDENILNNRYWLRDFEICQTSCYVDTIRRETRACVGECPRLRYSQVSGTYTHDSTQSETIFQRVFSVREVSDDEAMVTISVTWSERSFEKDLQIIEGIYKWQLN